MDQTTNDREFQRFTEEWLRYLGQLQADWYKQLVRELYCDLGGEG